jgi:hypothetical protein
MKTFEIEYHNETVRVSAEDNYKLSYSDGRWLVLEKRSDDTGTVSIFNDSTSYGATSVWAIQSKSEGPDWVNREQLQVIGELLVRKEKEAEQAGTESANRA